MTAKPPTCPRCGAALAPDAPEGLCPACLMEQGLEVTPTPAEVETVDAAAEAPTQTEAVPAGPTSKGPPLQQVGPYRLKHKLGEGGMGEVWLAEQVEPVKRQVALKLIKPGMDSRQVVARFEAERQALALMEHPAIARVFEAGTTERGSPYFVMEYVRGVPITEHCDSQRLSTGERLDLFMQVCEGVQHAHQKGIIHRDLKPSNVLVTVQDGKAQPKIIDFGVAKATAQKLTEATLMTGLGVLVGTPAYMSPEQADLTSEDIDTRSDVYALGVLLYELLAGALPFEMRELRQAGLEEILRHIREVDPPRPSARLTTLAGEQTTQAAAARSTELSTLRRRLQGDLDWIVMRALEKDRARRYGSPNELAADLRRHLEHEPVLAGPPSAAYRAKKFVRRHRAGVGFAAVLALLLVGVAVAMTVQAGRIARERDRANREADVSGRVSTFMVRLFEIPDPGEARGNEVTAREILDQGAKQIERGLKEDPVIRARMLTTMGKTYRNLGILDPAQPILESAVEILEQQPGAADPELADALFELGYVHFERSRLIFWSDGDPERARGFERARDYWTRTLAIRREVLPPDDPDLAMAITGLGFAFAQLGMTRTGAIDPSLRERAGTLAEEAEAIWQAHPDTFDWRAAINADLLAWISQERGDGEETMTQQEYALEVFDRAAARGKYWPTEISSLYNAAWTYRNAGRLEEAERLLLRCVEYRELRFGKDHVKVAEALIDLAQVRRSIGRLAEGIEILERALSENPNHQRNYQMLTELGKIQRDAGRFADARRSLERALALRERQSTMTALSQTLLRLGDIQGAYEYRRRVMEIREANPRYARSPALLGGRLQLADLLMRLGRFTEARPHLRGALELAAEGVDVSSLNPPPTEVGVYHELATRVGEVGELEDAHRLFQLALIGAKNCSVVTQRSALEAVVHRDWAVLLRKMGRVAEAADHESRAAELSAGAQDAAASVI